MAVMMSSQTVIPLEGYDMLARLGAEQMKKYPGFVAHAAYRTGEVMHVTEIWDSAEECSRYFAEVIHPQLPPGVKPDRKVTELHNLIKK